MKKLVLLFVVWILVLVSMNVIGCERICNDPAPTTEEQMMEKVNNDVNELVNFCTEEGWLV